MAETVDFKAELAAARDAINELHCALLNRIRSERAFDKYGCIAEIALERANKALGDE